MADSFKKCKGKISKFLSFCNFNEILYDWTDKKPFCLLQRTTFFLNCKCADVEGFPSKTQNSLRLI
jgi:hypothetical protein